MPESPDYYKWMMQLRSGTLNGLRFKYDFRTCCSVAGLPEMAAETFEKERQVTEPDPLGGPEDPWWGPQQVPSFPEFRQNNQLSYPLIYSYLASTEEQVSSLLSTHQKLKGTRRGRRRCNERLGVS